MEIIAIIVTILYVIWLNRLIKFAVKTATRIAVASEATAANLEFIVRRLENRS